MMLMKASIAEILVLFSLLNARHIFSGLQPAAPWPMYGRNQYQLGVSPFLTNTSKAGISKWSFTGGSTIRSAPSIDSDGTVYFGTDQGVLYAIDETSKSAKWTFTVPKISASTLVQIQSTPAISSDGQIYFGSYDFNFYSVSRSTGTLLWKFLTGNIIVASPTISSNGAIYFGSHDKIFYSLDSTGSQLWRYTTTGRIYTPAAISNGIVYFVSSLPDFRLYLLYESTGTRKSVYYLGLGTQSISGPVVDSSGIVYVGSNDGVLYKLTTGGSLIALYQGSASGIYGSPAVSLDGSTIFYGSFDFKVYAITSSGTLKWQYTTNYFLQTAPVIDGNGLVILGTILGDAYAFHPDTGVPVWKWSNNVGVNTAAIGADGTVFFTSFDAKLHAVGGGYSTCPIIGQGVNASLQSTTTLSTTSTSATTLFRGICSACSAGSYSTTYSQCNGCNAGYYSNSTGTTSCHSCPSGHYSASRGSSNCTACSSGQYSAGTASITCSLCSRGNYSAVSASVSCLSCAAGTFASSLGATTCTPCPNGTYTHTKGSTGCTGCAPGTYSSQPGTISCTPCPAGQYVRTNGSTSCLISPAGYYTDSAGSSSFIACPVGTYSNKGGETQCSFCNWPGYNKGEGNSECKYYLMLPHRNKIQFTTSIVVLVFSVATYILGIISVSPFRSARSSDIIVTRIGVALYLLVTYLNNIANVLYFLTETFESFPLLVIMWAFIAIVPVLNFSAVLGRVLISPSSSTRTTTPRGLLSPLIRAPFLALWCLLGLILFEAKVLFIIPVWNYWTYIYTGTGDFVSSRHGLQSKYTNKSDFSRCLLTTVPLLVLQVINNKQRNSWGYTPILCLIFAGCYLLSWMWRYSVAFTDYSPIGDIPLHLHVCGYCLLDLTGDGREDGQPRPVVVAEEAAAPGSVVIFEGGESAVQTTAVVVGHHQYPSGAALAPATSLSNVVISGTDTSTATATGPAGAGGFSSRTTREGLVIHSAEAEMISLNEAEDVT